MQVLIRSLLGACFIAQTAAAQGTWRGEQTRRGDTLIVRTISGSVFRDTLRPVPEVAIGSEDGGDATIFGNIASFDVDREGRIYVLDRQAFEVRVFGPDGKHLRTFGRRGGGPGEFENPQGVRVTPDGRVIVRDQSRFSVFTNAGTFSHGWNFSSGFGTNAAFFLTADQRVLAPTFFDGRRVWHRLDGTALDTVLPPQRMPPAPALQVRGGAGGGRASYSIPYMPGTSWTVGPNGKFISARTDRYEIDVPRDDGTILRIVRIVEPVPVPSGEADRNREQIVRNIKRSNDPNFEWTGPSIPKTKPLIGSLATGMDGTIWVFRSTPSIERKVDADVQKATGFATEWYSGTVADVFDSQGRYLVAVRFPDGMTTYPSPVLSMTNIWGIAMHADGYPQVVRYRGRAVVNEGR
jgi:hypothetical protein